MTVHEQALKEINMVLGYAMSLDKKSMYDLLCAIKNCAEAALVRGEFEPIDKREGILRL